ncbi:MAG: hypothetical protein ABI583_02445 [Betaproteobacteria bacterium]
MLNNFAALAAVFFLACCSLACGASPAEPEPQFSAMTIGKTNVQLQFSPGLDASTRQRLQSWIARSGRAVSDYFGEFPVPDVTILVITGDGAAITSGATFSDPELRIRVNVGRNTSDATYRADWIMVHEMIHLAIPEVPRNQNWFHEGAATYVEIIARARAGLSGSGGGWAELLRNIEQGMPQKGDRGLDHTPTWGRTYWGGAMFCLLADVELRKRSNNRVGLQDALRGIVAGGGNYSKAWSLEQALKVADAATGLSVLTDLHLQLKDAGGRPDLAALWRDLGISTVDGELRLRDDAPLSATRRAIIDTR